MTRIICSAPVRLSGDCQLMLALSQFGVAAYCAFRTPLSARNDLSEDYLLALRWLQHILHCLIDDNAQCSAGNTP